MNGSPWLAAAAGAGAALALVYAYAVAALWTHHRLARWRIAQGLAGALVAGLAVPACGCTALPYARRLAPHLRAPFLVAAYAGSVLLMAAAWMLAGAWAALAVAALALAAAATSRALPSGAAPAPRLRLDDLLLPREARPWRDAAPYLVAFGAPVALVGGVVGGGAALAPAWAKGLAFAALALAVAAPRADVAQDHGGAFARRLRAMHAAFALAGGVAVGVLA